ncbi:MAG: rod shape-determining protein RodA [Deltaproteobacteria bacterium]|nr:MAG: rod shape-determining protein RodA [Deltaproteobacteria bacterium]
MALVSRHDARLRVDWVLLLLVLLLLTFGMLNLRSAALVEGFPRHLTQLLWVLIGGTLAGLIASQDPRHASRWAFVAWGGALFLLLLVPFLGVTLNGSRRWLDFGAFLFQPSEIMKVALVLATARWLSDHPRPDGHRLRDLLVPFGLLGLPALLILSQPDLGTTLVMAFIFATMLLFERVRPSTIAILVLVAGLSVPFAWSFGLADYQRQRIATFFSPQEDLTGSAWQVNQSRIAIGSGQLVGKGYLQGTQVQGGFVPYHENDFIFAHHGEQFGFLGSAILLLLYFAVSVWGLRIARLARNRFGVLTAVGCSALIFWHVVVNIGMVTGSLPVVGLWLPFASYGGSAMITVMICIGLLLSISARRHTFS